MYKFWMIKTETGHLTKTHSRIEDARSEAKKLALERPGQTFYILETVEAYQTETPKVIEVDLDNIPMYFAEPNK